MGTYAIVENGKVVNRIEATREFMESLGVEFTDDKEAQIGRVRDNGKWAERAEKRPPKQIDLNTELSESEKQALIQMVRGQA